MVVNYVASVVILNPSILWFFECYHARFVWHALHIVFGLVPPLSVENLFKGWHKHGGCWPK